MKLSDYLALFLQNMNIHSLFGVTGGAVVHFFDSAHRYGIKNVFTHHEQAAAFAAHGYAKIHGIGACLVTTGPGGSNMVTGTAAAWLDSTPTLYIAGQVRRNQIKPFTIRQQGTQELDVRSILSPIVKYATTLMEPERIRYELEKCFHIATSGRPGPVYLEIPLDLHWAQIGDPDSLVSYFPEKPQIPPPIISEDDLQLVINRLYSAKAPLLLLGGGIRLGQAEISTEKLLQATQIPYLTTWTAADLMDGADPLNLGRPGMFGSRGANLAIQSCDFLCCLGTHLPISVTTAMFENFAKQADISLINIDPHELEHQRVNIKHRIHSDVKNFTTRANALIKRPVSCESWKEECRHLANHFNRCDVQSIAPRIDSYIAVEMIGNILSPQDAIVVDGGGTIVQIAFQTLRIKKGQRLIIDAGLCAMGSGLPQAIGVAFAKKEGNVICFCGDGSLQFNIQELQTIYHHQLPIKIFIFNNNGYLSIRHTQAGFLNSNFQGSAKEGGISIPDIRAITEAYKIPTMRVSSLEELLPCVEHTLGHIGPALCEIIVPSDQEIKPRIGFDPKPNGLFAARPIEDMYPYLSKEKLEMISRS